MEEINLLEVLFYLGIIVIAIILLYIIIKRLWWPFLKFHDKALTLYYKEVIRKGEDFKPDELATFLRQHRFDPVSQVKFYIWMLKNIKKIKNID